MTRKVVEKTILLLGLSLIVAGCGYDSRSYEGDGTLIDHGWYAGSDRYELDLGVADLTKSGRRQYRMAKLPQERLAVGFEVVPLSASEKLGQDRQLPFNPIVRVEMVSSSGELIRQERAINAWVVSTVSWDEYPAFAYCKGSGDHWNEQPGTAWGCVFKPKQSERYTMTIEVVSPDPMAASYRIELIIRGGSGFAS